MFAELHCNHDLCGNTEPATRSYDVTMISFTSAIIIDAFANNSKHDVTTASGSQATMRTCNHNSGSLRCKVSPQGAGNTIFYRYWL